MTAAKCTVRDNVPCNQSSQEVAPFLISHIRLQSSTDIRNREGFSACTDHSSAWIVQLHSAAVQDARELDSEPNGWLDMGTQREYKRSGKTLATAASHPLGSKSMYHVNHYCHKGQQLAALLCSSFKTIHMQRQALALSCICCGNVDFINVVALRLNAMCL